MMIKLPTRRLIASLLLVALFGAGCRLLDAPPTPQPITIIVTATFAPTNTLDPAAISPTPPPELFPTPVLGPVTTSLFPVLTATATPRPTQKPTLTPSFTPTYTDTAAPTVNVGVGTCTSQAQGGFAAIYNRDTALQQALGCAVSAAITITTATQDFEGGRMLYISQFGEVPTRMIYALYAGGTFQRFPDTWTQGVDPETLSGIEPAPSGRFAPIRGFGKVWAANPSVRSNLRWALGSENGATGSMIQRFERGEMIFIVSLGQTLITTGSTWRVDAGKF